MSPRWTPAVVVAVRWVRRHVDAAGFRVMAVVLFLVCSTATASAWEITFEEASHETGLDFRLAGEAHDPAGLDQDWPALPEIAGSGACWADFDGDGYEDLYIANQRYNDENRYALAFNDVFDPTNRLYLNDGDGGFRDVTKKAGVESRSFDYGCSGMDYDADGHVDLLVYGFGHIKLYHNDGEGGFTDATSQTGLDVSTSCLPHECMNTCSAWTDYDGDGWLDLFVCTFVETDMEDERRGPGGHVAQENFLFRNKGDGTFDEVAQQAGVQGSATDELGSKSWSAVFFDADLNGLPDLYVANDMTPNEFYWNNGDGTFTRDDEAGLFDARAGMGLASGDTTGSGFMDLLFTHYAFQHNGYYENTGVGNFTDRSGAEGLASDWAFVGWGTALVDLDRDGHLDAMVVNGHTEWEFANYDQSTLVFQHAPQEDGSTEWTDVSEDSGSAVQVERVSRGAAFADYDLDGAMDTVIVNNANQSLQFLRSSGAQGSWFYVQPVQEGPNHQAVGARVIVETGDVKQVREIQAGASFMSQNTLLADFGLGDATLVDRLTIQWPHGGSTVLEDLPVDRVVRVDRESGSYRTDTLTPRTTALFNGEVSPERWFSSDIEIALVAEDRAVGPESGLAWTEYRIDGADWTRYEGETFHYPDVAGNHTLRYRSMDHAGNREPVRLERFGIDLDAPVVDHEVEGTSGSNGWMMDAKVRLEAEDPLSGVDRILYRVDGGGPWGQWNVYGEPVVIQQGVHVLEYKAVDVAGNEASVESVTVQVDSIPPQVTLVRPDWGRLYHGDEEVADLGAGPPMVLASSQAAGAGGTDFTLRLDASDAVSGVERVDLWLNGEHVARVLDPDAQVTWTWNTTAYAAGTYLVQAVVQDEAGNPQSVGRSVVLVPATGQGAMNTLTGGPSLYPFSPVEWPLGPPD